MEQQNGVLVLNKPKGITSAKAISVLKRLGQKKIGHAGTLDPMATGVLLVLLGQATKLSNYLLEGGKKIYEGELKLGTVTDTWDIEGEVLEENDYSSISKEDVEKEVLRWLNTTSQIVPPYSAAKHKGKPLYALAREGKEVPVKVKEIHISHAEILSIDFPYVRFEVECSSGSYIRSLAHSLGQRLQCGACLTALNRLYSHPFGLDKACELDEIVDNPSMLSERLHPFTSALDWIQITCDEDIEQDLMYGSSIPHDRIIESGSYDLPVEFGTRAIFQSEDKTPIALMQANYQEGFSKPVWTILRGLWSA